MKNPLTPIMDSVKKNRFGQLLLATAAGWSEVRVSRLAASLSFYAMLSMVPLLITFHAIASLFMNQESLSTSVDLQLSQFIGADQAQALRSMIDRAQSPSLASLQTIIGSVLTFVTAAGVFIELKDSMDAVWKTPKQARAGFGSWVRSYFAPMSMVLGFGFLLLTSLLLQALLQIATTSLGLWQPALVAILAVGGIVISWLVSSALFAAIFRWLPTQRVDWRDIWLGAVITASLFLLGQWGISFYIGQSDFSGKYGSAGPIIAIIVWVYYSSQILFTGAVLTREHARAAGRFREPKPAEGAPAPIPGE